MENDSPLLVFGVLSDIQYADEEDCHNFDQTVLRHYRGTLPLLDQAVEQWNKEGTALVIQIGDLIDGKCSEYTQKAFQAVMERWKPLQCPLYHAVGNHELYNFSRAELKTWIEEPFYYSFVPCPGFRFVVLNSFEFSVAWKDQPDVVDQSWPLIEPKNPNPLRKAGVDWTEGLSGVEGRYLPFNGAIGPDQLEWLRNQLKEAEQATEKVIIISHCPLQEGCCNPFTLLWNYPEVMEVLHASPAVVCGLYGHDHAGGFCTDTQGIHHMTMVSPLECAKDSNAFATISLFADRLEIVGVGEALSCTLPYRNNTTPSA